MAYDYGRNSNALSNAISYIRCRSLGTDLTQRIVNLPAKEYVEALLADAILEAEENLGGEAKLDAEAQTLTVIKGADNIRLDRGAMTKQVMKALKAVGYDGWVSAEMIPNYAHYTETIIYNTSNAMDRILGRK